VRPVASECPSAARSDTACWAERALIPVLPSEEDFAYTLRVVSDVLQSNGSTSMASVCGSTLSLMGGRRADQGARRGIAMGLVYDDGKYVTLTDILGAEDAFGDMDFKVAGTADAVTAVATRHERSTASRPRSCRTRWTRPRRRDC